MNTVHFWFTSDARLTMEDVTTLLGSLCLTDVDPEAMTCKTLEKPEAIAELCHTIFFDTIPIIVSYNDELIYEYTDQDRACPDCGALTEDSHDTLCEIVHPPEGGYDGSDEV